MSEQEEKTPVYGAKVTEICSKLSIQDNVKYMDVRFDILLDGAVVADRHLAFPMESKQEEIQEAIKAYYKMYEADHASVAKAEAEMAAEKASEETMAELIGQEL